MFSSGPNYPKLKTNLRLAVNRLKLLEKKKTELALKARKEIADYLADGKVERARIRVEHIIREDYLVEAYEIVEMLADLLLARFGLLQQMKELDDGLAEAISSLIWIAPRLQSDVGELKIIGDALIAKYGKPYGIACHENSVGTVSPKLMQKMSVQAPPKLLIEKYLIEISKIYNVLYEPDHKVFEDSEDAMLIDMDGRGGSNNLGGGNNQPGGSGGHNGGGGGGGGGGAAAMEHPMSPPAGFIGYPYMPVPAAPHPGGQQHQHQPMHPPAYQPFQYPNVPAEEKCPMDSGSPPPKFSDFGPGFNIPPNDFKELNINKDDPSKPKPAPRGKAANNGSIDFPELPDLPTVPSTNPSASDSNIPTSGKPKSNDGNVDNDIDFDDLTKRFEELKKRK